MFSFLPGQSMGSLATGLLFTLIDLANSYALMQIANSGESVSTRLFTSPRKEGRLDGATVGIACLFNPFTIAACLGRSTSILTNTAIIHAVYNAIAGNEFRAMFALALASYLSLYPVLLLPPLALIVWDQTMRAPNKDATAAAMATRLGSMFLICTSGLLCLSFLVTGASWEFMSATYGFHLTAPDLTPNMGLWWYFLIEIFDPFRDFFLGVFWLHLVGYPVGLTLHIRRQPLFVVTTLIGIFAIFKPYPSISDVSLYLAFVPLYNHVLPRKCFYYSLGYELG
jgi:GPI-anchor transamidase subunit U